MIAKYFWIAGSVILSGLGLIHLYLTFFTNAFSSTNERLIDEMKSSSPVLSNEINVWKAWLGFNASHSSGLLFMGIINFYVAIRYFKFLQSDPFLFIFTILTIIFYSWLAAKYWFTIPLIGLSIVLACFILSYTLVVMGK